ncbi:MAG TPA: hypothetical protein VFZ80_03650 [Acidimicrobiia bacterium]
MLFGLVLIASGIGHVVNDPADNESAEFGELVESLIDRQSDQVMDTEGLASRLGYVPAVESGAWVDPDGICSTPIPVGPADFDGPCRSHDLGYDTLRLAASDDMGLGAWARLGLDARLYTDLLETCDDDVGCRAKATLYFGAVTANSIRQGYRSPPAEPVLPWAGLGVTVVGLSLFPRRAESPVRDRRLQSSGRKRPWGARSLGVGVPGNLS